MTKGLPTACTAALESNLDRFFLSIKSEGQGSVVYAKLMFDRVFPQDSWTADGLKDFLQGMADKGIKVMFVNKGENVRLASRVIILVCERLAELRALPHDTEKKVMSFYSKASDPDFVTFVERKVQATLDKEVDQPDFGVGTS